MLFGDNVLLTLSSVIVLDLKIRHSHFYLYETATLSQQRMIHDLQMTVGCLIERKIHVISSE